MCFGTHRAFLWHSVAEAYDAVQLHPATKAVCLHCKALIGRNLVQRSTNELRGSPTSVGGSKELETTNHFTDDLDLPEWGFLARMFRIVE